MDLDWLTEIRNKVSDDTYLEIVQYLDSVRVNFESMQQRVDNLEQRTEDVDDRLRHMGHALRMIAQVQPTEEGARMAMGLAEEAISAVGDY